MEKRTYSRIATDINGTLFKDGIEIPIKIVNVSENGIGIVFKTDDCPVDFSVHKKESFSIVFYDESTSGYDLYENNIQQCEFQIVHIKKNPKNIYIGGALIDSEYDYSLYVSNKKVKRFVARVKFMDFAHAL